MKMSQKALTHKKNWLLIAEVDNSYSVGIEKGKTGVYPGNETVEMEGGDQKIRS